MCYMEKTWKKQKIERTNWLCKKLVLKVKQLMNLIKRKRMKQKILI